MTRRVYLDTARLGLMSPSAQLISIDFARFAGKEAASLYFDDLLRHGAEAWPDSLRQRHPALASWRGIRHLKNRLKVLAGAHSNTRVMLAGRSASLMTLAAALLTRHCRNVLVADVCWPSYLRTLRRRMRTTEGRLTSVRIRPEVYRERVNAKELAVIVAESFVKGHCDSLFLPAVDNLGLRLPIEDIVQTIRSRTELRFVVIDGAQAFCQAPIDLQLNHCDIFLAGCHKWLQAYHPLGIALSGNPRSAEYIDQLCRKMLARGALDDPLLRYLTKLEDGRAGRYGETISIAPLFSCQGAVDDKLTNLPVACRSAASGILGELAGQSGWKLIETDDSLASRIILVRPHAPSPVNVPPGRLRQVFHEAGVAISAYARGVVRISLPDRPWGDCERQVLKHALNITRAWLERDLPAMIGSPAILPPTSLDFRD